MVHGVEILREGYFRQYGKDTFRCGYMATVCLVLTLVGLYLVRDAGQKVEGR